MVITDLHGLLDSVPEERRLVLAVMEQDVEGHLPAHQLVDGRFYRAVEVFGRVRVIQHVVDLRRVGGRHVTSVIYDTFTS